jgi:tetratricopeptide (TPR) repeat protein
MRLKKGSYDVQQLQEALEIIRNANRLFESEELAEEHDDRAEAWNVLSLNLRSLADATGDLSFLHEAVDSAHRSVAVAIPASDVFVLCAANLSATLSVRYKRGAANQDDLREAIKAARLAVSECNHEGPSYKYALSVLSDALAEWYEYAEEDLEYLNESIDIARQLAGFPREKFIEKRGRFMLNFAISLQLRFRRSGVMDDLRDASKYFGEAVNEFDPASPDHIEAVVQFADSEVTYIEATGDVSGLGSALTSLEAIDLNTYNSSQSYTVSHAKARLYRAKHEAFSQPGDIDNAVLAAEDALAKMPRDSPQRHLALQTLSNQLGARAACRQSHADSDLAIQLAEERLSICPSLPAHQSGAYTLLANRLRDRYSLFGGAGDLDLVVQWSRRALETLPEDHVERPSRFHNLALALGTLYDVNGQMAALNESVELEREAVRLMPQTDLDRCMILDGLGYSLLLPFRAAAASEDLEESI